jgi:glycosyltransferase involved in cell wall biosynthesis
MSQGQTQGHDTLLEGKCVALCTYSAWSVLNYRMGLVKALLAVGAKVVVVSPEDEFVEQVEALGCVFEPMDLNTRGTSPLNDFKGFLRYRKVFKAHKVDLVLNYTIKPVIYATLAGGMQGRRVINTITGIGETFNQKWIVKNVIKTLYRVSQRYADVVFFQNKDQRAFFLQMGLMKESQTRMIAGSGVDTTKYAFSRLKINPVFTFLLMGRLLKPKGIYEYVEAGRILKKQGLNFRLQLAGEFRPGRDIAIEEADLKAWVSAGEVEYLGMVADVPALIAAADCVVLPSYTEGTPRALLEACAVGRPIIATDVEGCREVLVNGENGLFCQPKSAQSLAEAMGKMMGMTYEARLEMGHTGRYLAQEKFDEGKVVGVYMKMVKELVR